MPRVVLVTGVGRFIGLRVAAALAADDDVERVIGIDTVAPAPEHRELLGRTEVVRADVRNPLLGTVLEQGHVDTVVHAGLTRARRGRTDRRAYSDHNVVGAMQLLAACQKSSTVRRLVVKSTDAVYGGAMSAQSVFRESDPPPRRVTGAFTRDAVDVEAYVRGLGRRRPDIAVCVARLAHVLGPTIETNLSRYLAGPVVPTPLGRDPRLQFLHEQDAVRVLHELALGEQSGVHNVAGSGVLLLSQAVRRAGRVRLPVAPPLLAAVASAVGNNTVFDLLASDPALLDTGRVVDTTSMRRVLGFEPQFTTAQTYADYLTAVRPLPTPGRTVLELGEHVIRTRSAGRRALRSAS